MINSPIVDVWTVRWVDFDKSSLQHLLHDHERARAERFRDASVRSRFVIARGLLRQKLADELRTEPASVPIVSSPRGKPVLKAPFDGIDLRFSVSHADEVGLIGIGRGKPIGVDIEGPQGRRSLDRLAHRFFTPYEAAQLRRLAQSQRHEAFLRIWTAKESLIKARGEAVPSGLRRYAVELGDDGSVALLSIDGNERAARDWRLETVALDADHIATVAIQAPDARIRWHRIPPQSEQSERR